MHQISVAASGFLTTGSIPEGVLQVTLPPQYTSGEATPSHLVIKEEEIVNVSDSEDDYKVFNQPLSPKISIGDLGHLLPAQTSYHQEVTNMPDAMGIQRKLRPTLQELLES